ncbi:D-2-hydroxyacid dehydrogenase [Niastella yeongjuensis]|uniref:D-2-hydroxyacid dehydrogenase n=1 Tax=Niastella yeongjuensis TaxID=354355 RepID=UPI0008D7544C|nr:D-2-hydroxyacid dehydrogenase [Niastella yeongjuensis]SEO76920.1 glycerate dehydrogenase [Niastella yeongjuensis]
MIKIVVTDGYTLNPGDLSWKQIEALGELKVYDRTKPEEIVDHCRDAQVVLTNKVPFSEATLAQLPQLKMIGVTATGYNIIDVVAAAKKGIVVSNVPAYGTASVAQHTIALLLELTNQVGKHAASVAAGDWAKSADFSYTVAPLTELAGKTMGIVGWGNIGQQTARIAQALGMELLYYTPSKKENAFAEWAPLPELFAKADYVSLHCPLKPDNMGFVNNDLLKVMKPGACIINTSRGQLINEQHLADALNEGRIAGAALDVLSVEPPSAGNPLLSAKNCILTPHIAWISKEARERVMATTVANVAGYLNNKPVHVVS